MKTKQSSPIEAAKKPNRLQKPIVTMVWTICSLALLSTSCTSQQQQQNADQSTRRTNYAPQRAHEAGMAENWTTQGVSGGGVRGGSQQQQQQQRQKPAPPPAPAPSKPAPAPVATTCSDPTSGLIRMTKTMPREVGLGKEFEATINFTAQACAANVVIRDLIPSNASYVRSEPEATADGAQLVWRVGDLDAGESRSIKVWMKADKEGTIVNCASVTSDPRTCASIRVVNPAIRLTKTEPKDVAICDPIPVSLVVRNAGTSQLTGVKVTDNLPTGLTADGKSSLVFDAGTLAPGESKEFKFNATAARAGSYENSARASADQGVSADASASTAVHQAVLQIACKAREQQYLGRPFEVCFTISNTGDVAASGTQVVLPIPAGLTFVSATEGGQASGGNVVWNLASLASDARTVCATFSGATGGNYTFNASAKGTCAAQVNTSCSTRLLGVGALLLEKADNPDPIQVGETTTYNVRVTNQGTADDTNVKMVVEFPAEIDPVSASNGGTVSGKRVTFPAFPRLAPKQAFEYTIVAKGVKVGDARVTFIRTSDGIPAPTSAEESTRVY
jgi:uncharacterized repeat protein (TIGR01451 family)